MTTNAPDADDPLTRGMLALQATPFEIGALDRALGAGQAPPPTWLCEQLFQRAADEGHAARVSEIARDPARRPRLRAVAARVLLSRGFPWTREVLHALLRAEDVWTRIVSCEALRQVPDPISIPALTAALDDDTVAYDMWAAERVSNHAALGLSALPEGRALPVLARWIHARHGDLTAEDATTRHLAIMALAELRDAEGIAAARRERERDDPFGE